MKARLLISRRALFARRAACDRRRPGRRAQRRVHPADDQQLHVPDRRRSAAADLAVHAAQQLRGAQGRRRTSPATARTRRTARSSAASPTAAPTASPAARRCGSPAAPTRRPARAGSDRRRSFTDTAHITARCRSTARSCATSTTAASTASPAARRCSCAATWAPGCTAPTTIDGQTLAKLGTATPGDAAHAPVPARRRRSSDQRRRQPALPLRGRRAAADRRPRPAAKQIIDSRTLVQQGTATAALPHLRAVPGRRHLPDRGRRLLYRVAGGAAVQLTNCAVLGNCPGAVAVDPAHDLRRAPAAACSPVPEGRHGPARHPVQRAVGDRRRRAPPDVRQRRGRRQSTTARSASSRVPAGPAPVVLPPSFEPGHLQRLQGLPPLHAVHVAEGQATRPAGSRDVTCTCDGRRQGCPFKKAKQYRLRGSSLNVVQPLVQEGQAATGGATVVVRVSSPSGDRKQMTFKIRSRKLPVRTTRCSAAGGKLGKCA